MKGICCSTGEYEWPVQADLEPLDERFDDGENIALPDIIPNSVRLYGRKLNEHERLVMRFHLALQENASLWGYTHRFARDYLLYSVEERKRLQEEAETLE